LVYTAAMIDIMGVKNLLLYLPEGKNYLNGFDKAGIDNKPANLDAAGLMWFVANQHADTYLSGNLYPSVRCFQQVVLYLWAVRKWKLLVLFDGEEEEAKKHKRLRRDKAAARI
jgi:hypothetical protein